MRPKRARYTLEFKQEAVRLVESGQSIAAAARSLGMVDQTAAQLGQGLTGGQAQGC
jgi:transposase-like protein